MLGDPVAGALRPGLGGGDLGGGGGGGVAVVIVAVPGGFEAAGVGVGRDDGWGAVSASFSIFLGKQKKKKNR